MKWIKICALIVLTLGAMRVGSWTLGWLMARLAPLHPRYRAIASNAVAFGVFALLLLRSLLPGEPLDWAAVWFGLVVFAVYCVADFYWTPWKANRLTPAAPIKTSART